MIKSKNSKDTISIYGLIDPRDNQLMYIGKSKNLNKRLEEHLQDTSICPRTIWLNSLKKKGYKPKLKLIDKVSVSEGNFWENHYISLYQLRGKYLHNNNNNNNNNIIIFLL